MRGRLDPFEQVVDRGVFGHAVFGVDGLLADARALVVHRLDRLVVRVVELVSRLEQVQDVLVGLDQFFDRVLRGVDGVRVEPVADRPDVVFERQVVQQVAQSAQLGVFVRRLVYGDGVEVVHQICVIADVRLREAALPRLL